jgi:hypothetical protein
MKSLNYTLIIAVVAIATSCEQVQPVEAVIDAPATPVEADQVSVSDRVEEEHELFKTGYADSVNLGLITEDRYTGSARREAIEIIDGAEITVNYGSPGMRGRVLWNGLVSYDQVWVSGSHWATAVSFGRDVMIENTNIEAGTYAFCTIPGRTEWTLILNKNYDQHLADDYDEKLDLVRVSVTPLELPQSVQRLTYVIDQTADKQGALRLRWDKLEVSVPFTVLP